MPKYSMDMYALEKYVHYRYQGIHCIFFQIEGFSNYLPIRVSLAINVDSRRDEHYGLHM